MVVGAVKGETWRPIPIEADPTRPSAFPQVDLQIPIEADPTRPSAFPQVDLQCLHASRTGVA
jgi:hypothetical protein